MPQGPPGVPAPRRGRRRIAAPGSGRGRRRGRRRRQVRAARGTLEEGPEALLGLASPPPPPLPSVAMQTPVLSCSPAARCSRGAGITDGSR
ncbi:hypothetical protein GRJ2_002479600 [Grus japonensis]|uniref:Uncharacterized protein n=1 Tax=Grus japonensis TaxID=30415 RepID=A0ABC9XUC3_GRUJA